MYYIQILLVQCLVQIDSLSDFFWYLIISYGSQAIRGVFMNLNGTNSNILIFP